MFEQEIQNEKNRVLSLFNSNNDCFLKDILLIESLDQHYKSFLKSEVIYWIFEIMKQLKESPYFELRGKDDQSNCELMISILLKSAKIPCSEIPKILDSAVQTYFNFTIRPRTTLKHFIFGNKDEMLLNEIIYKLNYFLESNYLIQGFINYIKNNIEDDDTVTLSRFNSIIKEIDDNVFSKLSYNEINNLFTNLYKLFYFSFDNPGESKIPTEALIIYFDDKSLTDCSNYFANLLEKNVNFVIYNDLMNYLQTNFGLVDNTNHDQFICTLPSKVIHKEYVSNEETVEEKYGISLNEIESKINEGVINSKEDVKNTLINLVNSFSYFEIQSLPDSQTPVVKEKKSIFKNQMMNLLKEIS